MHTRIALALRLILGFLFLVIAPGAKAQSPQYNYIEEIFALYPDPDTATAKFYEALSQLREPSKKNEERLQRLLDDILHIEEKDEQERLRACEGTEEKIAFLQTFWRRRDLTPATVRNERLIEHYQRLKVAREKYFAMLAPGYDDRGMIYVRFGPPDNYVISAGDIDAVGSESWVYHRGKDIVFDFADRGFQFVLVDNLARAVKGFRPTAQISTLARLLAERAIISYRYTGPFVRLLDMGVSLQPGVYEPRLRDPNDPTRTIDDITALAIVDRIMTEFTLNVKTDQSALPAATTSMNVTPSHALPHEVLIARFEDTPNQQLVEAFFALRQSDLRQVSENPNPILIRSSALKDTAFSSIFIKTDTLHLTPEDFDENGLYLVNEEMSILPGTYYYAIDLDNFAANQRGLSDYKIDIGVFPAGSLHLSSLLFATKIIERPPAALGAPLERHGLAIFPYPFMSLQKSDPWFTYFEIYDLRRDAEGATNFTIDYEVRSTGKKGWSKFFAALNPFGGKSSSISLRDSRTGTNTTEPCYLGLDFSQLKAGKYVLTVRVTDNVANLAKDSRLEFELN